MSKPLVLEPDEIRAGVPDTAALPQWLASVAQYAMEAADAGETISVRRSDEMLSPAEVAHRLNVSRSTVARRIEAGEIAAVKVGTHNRVRYAEFMRYRDQLMTSMVQAIAGDIDADPAVS